MALSTLCSRRRQATSARCCMGRTAFWCITLPALSATQYVEGVASKRLGCVRSCGFTFGLEPKALEGRLIHLTWTQTVLKFMLHDFVWVQENLATRISLPEQGKVEEAASSSSLLLGTFKGGQAWSGQGTGLLGFLRQTFLMIVFLVVCVQVGVHGATAWPAAVNGKSSSI